MSGSSGQRHRDAGISSLAGMSSQAWSRRHPAACLPPPWLGWPPPPPGPAPAGWRPACPGAPGGGRAGEGRRGGAVAVRLPCRRASPTAAPGVCAWRPQAAPPPPPTLLPEVEAPSRPASAGRPDRRLMPRFSMCSSYLAEGWGGGWVWGRSDGVSADQGSSSSSSSCGSRGGRWQCCAAAAPTSQRRGGPARQGTTGRQASRRRHSLGWVLPHKVDARLRHRHRLRLRIARREAGEGSDELHGGGQILVKVFIGEEQHAWVFAAVEHRGRAAAAPGGAGLGCASGPRPAVAGMGGLGPWPAHPSRGPCTRTSAQPPTGAATTTRSRATRWRSAWGRPARPAA